MSEIIKADLLQLYSNISKHSNYQSLPRALQDHLGEQKILTKSRYEYERFNYILKKLNITDMTILDIGGNTGFFTIEALINDAKKVYYYEGNKEHSLFIEKALQLLQLNHRAVVSNQYYRFDNNDLLKFDLTFLLNVLHHTGDDYGPTRSSLDAVKNDILIQLNQISKQTRFLVFQLGFNWRGDIKNGLFKNGTKQEMIDFITSGIHSHWKIESIGIAEKIDDKIEYREANSNNLVRNESLGEFLNRPLFIMKSTHFN